MHQPQIEVVEMPQSAADDTKLKFTATVERRPEFELPNLEGLEIAVDKAEVSDDDVNNRLGASASVSPPSWVSTVRHRRVTSPTST